MVTNKNGYQLVTLRHIWQARKRISPIVPKTPLMKSETLSKKTGKNIYLKLETVHDIGAFKIRGAANKILSLSTDERKRGVTTFSTGNHGLAVALVAKKLGIGAIVCLSNRVPDAKIAALKNFGAEVERVGYSQDDARAHCQKYEKEFGMTIVPPFDDQEVIAGQGTIGIELLEELPEIDQCVIPLSGGGLLSGISVALKSADKHIKVSGVSIEGASAMSESLKKGRPIEVSEKQTLADSLLGGIGENNQYTFRLVQQFMDELILLSERSIEKGITHLFKKQRLIVEGAAAVGVGAVLDGQLTNLGDHTVFIISGNNMDPSSLKGV